MRLSSFTPFLWALAGTIAAARGEPGAAPPSLEVDQLTQGPKHHFFGYIGHAGTIPWNASGRYIVALQTEFQDHMPRPDEAADIILIDTRRGNTVRVVDQTRAWNFQQGTMLYWNPEAPETQFFFNDRDPASGRVFCVLFNIEEGTEGRGRRVKEYRFDDTPVGNSGVAQSGGSFLGLNYGRLAHLRLVTGYPGAHDWTQGVKHPDDDGIFRIDAKTGAKQLIVSYKRLADQLRSQVPGIDDQALFINHTLWNRDGDRIFFYARADFDNPRKRLDALFVMAPDGTGLKRLPHHIGGHLEWDTGHRMLGGQGGRHALYDTDRLEFVEPIGDPGSLPEPNGDKALSPRADWLVNGFRQGTVDYYVFFRRSDRTSVRSRGFDQLGWTSGELRVDPAPCWNRDGTEIVFPSLTDDPGRTRQLFRIRLTSSNNR